MTTMENIVEVIAGKKSTFFPPHFDDIETANFVTFRRKGAKDRKNKHARQSFSFGSVYDHKMAYGIEMHSRLMCNGDWWTEPLTKKDLEDGLEVQVDLLRDFERITDDPMDFEIGVHGIEIDFQAPAHHNDFRVFNGVYLPDKIVDNGWN